MNKKTVRLALSCLVALSAGFTACERETLPDYANFHSIPNSNSLSKRVADAVEIAPNEYVFWGTELQSNNQWDLYAVRVNSQGIVWEQRYQANAIDDQAICLRWYNNELWAVGYQSGAAEISTVFKIDAASGNALSSLDVNNTKINDMKWDGLSSGVIVVGGTSNVNTNKPQFDPSTDTRDIFVANLMSNGTTTNISWQIRYGFGGVDEAKTVYPTNTGVIAFTNVEENNGQQTGMIIMNNNTGGVINQRSFDYAPNTLDLGTTLSNGQTNGFELVALANNGNIIRQSVSIPTNSTINYNNQNISIQNLEIQNLFANGSNYLLTGNNNGQAKIYKLDNNFATQGDITLSASDVAANASNISISKGVAISNNQFLVAVNYTVNGVQEIGFIKLDSNGNLIP